MTAGILLAYVLPSGQPYIYLLGDLFVSGLKAIAPLLVFVLVSASIARHTKGAGAKLKPILVLYVAAMFLSAAVALFMARMFPSIFSVLAEKATSSAPQEVSDVLISCIKMAVDNPVNAIISGNYIGTLFWGILFGIIFRAANDHTKALLSDFASIVSGVVRIVICFAPLGVFGLVYASCTKKRWLCKPSRLCSHCSYSCCNNASHCSCGYLSSCIPNHLQESISSCIYIYYAFSNHSFLYKIISC